MESNEEIIGTKDAYTKNIIIQKLEINDLDIIAETFNEYFVNVGVNLLSKVLESYASLKPIVPEMTKTLNDTNMR